MRVKLKANIGEKNAFKDACEPMVRILLLTPDT